MFKIIESVVEFFAAVCIVALVFGLYNSVCEPKHDAFIAYIIISVYVLVNAGVRLYNKLVDVIAK